MTILKLKLDQDQLVEDFFESTHLIGIASTAPDYQLCWHINRYLHTNFRVNNSLEITLSKKTRSFHFTVLEFHEPTNSVAHYFYNNHCQAEFLLPELKNIHFLWMIKGDYYQPDDVKKLLEELRHVPLVQLVSLLDIKEIRNKMNLIF
ncbi:IPExxxVDY family protein [Chitinophaga nivalis]|uniref:IPExxxVDY family protein n=1 Tax=Chitinophaga nivalis TaxID=2991709 RepID=A0ABT3IVY7_9BACT|nr:IPExxxVDY family protein [Chitinophaga nivalis]MCW3462162.1 IPExxxVDY family protein [Chitinophaga nivalis]MCW3488146.1 IPExxxVDY family protein [Chitinophaga nivalis]